VTSLWHLRVECWISKAIRTHAHEQAHAPWHPHAHVDTEKFLILFFRGNSDSRKRLSVTLYDLFNGYRIISPKYGGRSVEQRSTALVLHDPSLKWQC
jgi:hypothetical protein